MSNILGVRSSSKEAIVLGIEELDGCECQGSANTVAFASLKKMVNRIQAVNINGPYNRNFVTYTISLANKRSMK